MDYKFFLDSTEIEEPVGWNDFELSMRRDDVYHGMQFEVSTGSLRFFGIASDYLRNQKDTNGIFSNVTFIAQSACDEEGFTSIIEGRLNFGKYKEYCGNLCLIEVPFEEDGCKVTFKNRFDQKVDMDKNIGADDQTVLVSYSQLGQTMPMPGVGLDARVEGYVAAPGDSQGSGLPAGGTDVFYIRPSYADERFNSIATGQLTGENFNNFPFPITPQLLFEDKNQCFGDDYVLSARLKGVYDAVPYITGTLDEVQANVLLWNGEGDIQFDSTNLEQQIIQASPVSMPVAFVPFDVTFNITIPNASLVDSVGVYVVLTFVTTSTTDGSPGAQVIVGATFDTDTFFSLSTKKLCPDTDVQYYMVHEALSRVTESITNACMRVKSSFFGRIDSQPFSFDGDGCGAFLMLTSGLKIRKAPNAKFFASAKDLIGGLNAIFNIGFTIEPDPNIAGKMLLIIESVDYFYQDFEMLSLDSVNNIANELQEGWHYAKIKVGYKKWEVEEINGLNEFNSNREYRTNVETISTELDITSNIVTGSIPAEITRQQSFADSGAADTTYDNEVFAFVLDRTAYDYTIQQDNILNPVNIYDPASVFNFYITPVRNLMRWFKSIINTYPNITSSTSRLFFNSGTGNFIASGQYDDANVCSLENSSIAENENIWIGNFANQAQATPLYKNETATFDYPLSMAQYNQIKANPYGYISYTCGQSSTPVKGFIKEIKFKPARGMANFTLRKKW